MYLQALWKAQVFQNSWIRILHFCSPYWCLLLHFILIVSSRSNNSEVECWKYLPILWSKLPLKHHIWTPKTSCRRKQATKNLTPPPWVMLICIYISSLTICASLIWDTLVYSTLVELLLTQCKRISANFHETTVLTGLDLRDN